MSDPSQPGSTHLSRQELYEKVWTVSMRKLAAEYGLSDVGLAKTCDRHEIPKPPVGYWAKHEVGKAPPRPPLPPASNPSLEKIPLSHMMSVQAPPAPPEPTDPEIVQMLARARALVVQPVIQDTKLHPVAERTLRALEKAAKSGAPDKGLFNPHWQDLPLCFEVHASQTSFGRIARILDALMRTCDQMGMKIQSIDDRDRRGQVLEFLGERFRFYIREKVKQRPRQPKPDDRYSYHKYDHEPQGVLELRLLKDGYSVHSHRSWIDRKNEKIEESLGEVIEAMVLTVDETRKARAAEKQRELERREAERVAEENRRRRQEDLASARNLLDQTERWHAAEAIRRYAAAVRAMVEARGPIEPGSRAEEWLQWAARTADRLDPITADKETGLTLDNLYPPPEPRWNAYQQMSEVHRGRPTWLGGWPNIHRR